jgi:hypothetical protein
MSEVIRGYFAPQSVVYVHYVLTVETCYTNWLNSISQLLTIVDGLPVLMLCSADLSLIVVSFSLDGL